MTHYKEAMVDLETLDTKTSGIILSVGIVLFNLEDVDTLKSITEDRCYYDKFNTNQQLEAKRTASASTALWHFHQEHSKDVSDNNKAIQLQLYKLQDFIDGRKLWGNGSSFDNAMLRSLFEQFEVPFNDFYQDCDLRTLKYISKYYDRFENPEPHNALSDAKCQTIDAQRAYKLMYPSPVSKAVKKKKRK